MSRVIQGPFIRGDGLEWLLPLPEGDFGPSDDADAPARSRLILSEDGSPLSPHAIHSEIVALGQGRFSHWGGWLRFSSSDGSDPNINGRVYSVDRSDAARPSLLALGSCHMHAAVRALARQDKVEPVWSSPALSYSPGETLQLLRHFSGEDEISGELTDIALSAPPAGGLSTLLGAAEYAAVEFSALTDIEMCGLRLIRSRVDDILLAPLVALGPAEGAVARKWYIYGLLRRNEKARSAAVEEMLPLLDRVPDLHPLARQVLLMARGRPSTIDQALDDFSAITGMLGASRVALMLSHNLFSPRGDPVSWDGYFPEEMKAAAMGRGIRAFLSCDVVLAAGVEAAMESDLLHFRPSLDAAIGSAILATLTTPN